MSYATQPSQDSTPVVVSTPAQAQAVVQRISPNLPIPLRQIAATNILKIARSGRRIYQPKRGVISLPTPVLIGIGAVVLLAFGLMISNLNED